VDIRCHDGAVQIIEVTDFGVRSAAVRLRRPGTPLQFVVYPMIHMAKPGFYRDVTRALRAADVVVVEGVGGKGGRGSLLVGALTLSYRVMRLNPRHQLVEQDIRYADLPGEIVRPDVDAAGFRAGWRRIPTHQRVIIWVALPFIILTRLFGGTKRIWSAAMAQDDLPTPKEEAAAETTAAMDDALLGERDVRLLAALARLDEERGHEAIEVAVVYGAGHVPAIVQGMARLGYRPRSGEWLTIVDL
jgi:hypothetical protein